ISSLGAPWQNIFLFYTTIDVYGGEPRTEWDCVGITVGAGLISQTPLSRLWVSPPIQPRTSTGVINPAPTVIPYYFAGNVKLLFCKRLSREGRFKWFCTQPRN